MKTRPNVLCIITDDTDFSMLGHTGGRVLTPNIDRIAAEGVVCSKFYTASPVCQPSRYNYLTGRYSGGCPTQVFDASGPHRDEPYCLLWNTDLHPQRERTFADGLRRSGYRTGYVGKWHAGPSRMELGIDQFEGDEDPADPTVREQLLSDQAKMQEQVRSCGFDYAAGITWGNADDRRIKRLRVHNLEWICKGALDFLDEQAGSEEPFYLYVCTSTIHGPSHILGVLDDERLTGVGYEDDHVGCMPPRKSILWRLEDTPGVGINHRSVGALWTDDLVGVLVSRLAEMGIAEDTAVVFSTDHNCFDGKASC
jgi:arylsulfatase A-like enzyme